MRGQIAGATPLSQLFIYMNNWLKFWAAGSPCLKEKVTWMGLVQVDSGGPVMSLDLVPGCQETTLAPGLIDELYSAYEVVAS